MLTVAEPPGTSPFVATLTIFRACVCVFPGATILPRAVTVMGMGPIVTPIPTQPLKLFRICPRILAAIKGVSDTEQVCVETAYLKSIGPYTWLTDAIAT